MTRVATDTTALPIANGQLRLSNYPALLEFETAAIQVERLDCLSSD